MRSWTCAFLLVGCLLAASCQHRLAVPETPFDPKVNYTLPQLMPVKVGDLSLKIPALDFKSLELSEFMPPGATPIWPEPRVQVKMYETPKEKFPSTAESVAPDNMAVVGSRSATGGEAMRHRLRLFRRGDADPTTILE